MEQNQPVVVQTDGGSGALIAVVVIVLVAVAAFIGYRQGWFKGQNEQPKDQNINITVPTTSK
jgi:hypothetical protein